MKHFLCDGEMNSLILTIKCLTQRAEQRLMNEIPFAAIMFCVVFIRTHTRHTICLESNSAIRCDGDRP